LKEELGIVGKWIPPFNHRFEVFQASTQIAQANRADRAIDAHGPLSPDRFH
jgi:hypothetical protein